MSGIRQRIGVAVAQELHLEARLRPGQRQRDVVGLDPVHTHVRREDRARDDDRLVLHEAEEAEEGLGPVEIPHGDGDVIESLDQV